MPKWHNSLFVIALKIITIPETIHSVFCSAALMIKLLRGSATEQCVCLYDAQTMNVEQHKTTGQI